jgi:hypothetical protein
LTNIRILKVFDFDEMAKEIDQEALRARISGDEIEIGEEG